MRLYFKPGACSLAPRIVMAELGIDHESIAVDTAAGLTATGQPYEAINPRGYIPALELDDGTVITENPAILQYLGDLQPAAGMAPPAGTLERIRLQQWLNFISAELHKAFSPFFKGRDLAPAERDEALAGLSRRIGDVEHALDDGYLFLLGDQFSVADAYLFVVLNWAGYIGVDLNPWPHVSAYVAGLAKRPAIRSAMAAEGLLEAA